MVKDKSGNAIKPEEFTVSILLPHYVIEELKDVAQFHGATLEEEATRALLRYHAECMADLIKGQLE